MRFTNNKKIGTFRIEMDDFMISNLHESRNEWCSRLVGIFSPLVLEGIRSIFNESWKMCLENDELGKYLMTFQNLLSRVPKWNNVIIEEECRRIVERSGCNYLEDLITCVHIIQLKILTCIRVGNRQKKIDISVPKLDVFVHKVYIHAARKMYSNVYLFEKNISPLQYQKNHREIEQIIQECIMLAIRESIPTEEIIRAYMDETEEQEEEITIENIEEDAPPPPKAATETSVSTKRGEDASEAAAPFTVPTIKNIDEKPVITQLTFNDFDTILNGEDEVQKVEAPKTIERLEEISTSRAIQRKLEEESDDEEEISRIRISNEMIDLTGFDVLDEPDVKESHELVLNDVEELF
jgi:hypothetical protein